MENSNNRDAEFLRRIKLLGLSGEVIPDLGFNGDFYPVDPEAEPLHPDWVSTTAYGGGAYDSTGVFHGNCRNQFCGGYCEICERNTSVLIHGRKYYKFNPRSCTFFRSVGINGELWGISPRQLLNAKIGDEIAIPIPVTEGLSQKFCVTSKSAEECWGFLKTASSRPEDQGIIYQDEWACFHLS